MPSDSQATIVSTISNENICSFPWGWPILNDAVAAIKSVHCQLVAAKVDGVKCLQFGELLRSRLAEEPINRLADGLMVTDAKRQVMLFNHTFAKLFAVTSQVPQQLNAKYFYGPAEHFIAAFAKGNSITPFRAPKSLRFTLSRYDHFQFSADVCSVCIRSDTGQVIGYVDIVRDLTAFDWLVSGNSTHQTLFTYHLSQWCETAGNDLRSAITGIRASARFIEQASCNADIHKALREIDLFCVIAGSTSKLLTGAATNMIQEL